MMKKAVLVLILFMLAFLQINAQKHAITPEELWQMKRIGAMDISPDGKTIAFQITTYDMEDNSGQHDIYLINTDGTNLRPLKNSENNESSPKFSADGKTIAYRYKGQIWVCDYEGKNDKQITKIYSGASGLVWAEDGKSFLFTSMVWPDCPDMECNKQKDEAEADDPVDVMVFEELMYRHWNDWRGPKRSHLFKFNLETNEYYDLTLFSNFDVPVIALGSANDYSISPDGDEVAFTMNTAKVLATSTNNDIFTLKLADFKKGEKNSYKKISESKGNDNQPVFSPCGKFIAFRSMEREGFEADKQRLMLYNRETGKLKSLSDHLDISFGQLVWSPDSKYIYYTSTFQIHDSIYKFETFQT